jgi:hypothetical protein
MNHLSNLLGTAVVLGTAAWVLSDAHAASLLQHVPPADFRPTGPIPPVIVKLIPEADLPSTCNLTPERLVGCSVLYKGVKCLIYVGKEEKKELMYAVIDHEVAHCAGWVHVDD